MGEVRYEILGPLRAWIRTATGERELDLGPAKQRAVLAVLLSRVGEPVPVDQILDAVWQEDRPANGLNVVQKNVARLRRILEPERSPRARAQLLSLTDAGYLLRVDPAAVDSSQFFRRVRHAHELRDRGQIAEAAAELRAALATWRGEPFQGLTGPYFDVARTCLGEDRGAAAELWAELELACGQRRDLIAELSRLVAEFPLRGALRRALMIAFYRAGRPADALAVYQDFRTLLLDGHGLEPGPELRELHDRMLRDDPGLVLPEAVVAAARAPDTQTVPSQARRSFAAQTSFVPFPPLERPEHRPPMADPPARSAVSAVDADVLPGGWRQGRRPGQRPWVANVTTVIAVLVAFGSVGLLSWFVILCYGIYRHSWRILGAAAGHVAVIAVVIWFVMSDAANDNQFGGYDLLAFVASLVSLFGGPLQIVLINPRVRAVLARRFGARRVDSGRIRREQARSLLHERPVARVELGIGRPDLPGGYDDGGLVDVNSVAEHVLWHLPGLTPEQGRQIAVDRWLRGPYASMEDLAVRCQVPPVQARILREILLFLPPLGRQPPPAGPARSMP